MNQFSASECESKKDMIFYLGTVCLVGEKTSHFLNFFSIIFLYRLRTEKAQQKGYDILTRYGYGLFGWEKTSPFLLFLWTQNREKKKKKTQQNQAEIDTYRKRGKQIPLAGCRRGK